MPRITYNKTVLTIAQQLELLEEKGIVITDKASAEHWLSHIGYFRFKHYSLRFKDAAKKSYIAGIEFQTINELYSFDRKLRMLTFEALENIEVAVKTQLSNSMSASYGPHWYTDARHFLTELDRKQIIRTAKSEADIPKFFDYGIFLKGIEDFMSSSEEPLFQLYKNTYEPQYPPSWMMVEIITFGKLSKLYANLQAGIEKTAIHDHFGLTKKIFTSWLHCFSFIRNKCAHHDRLLYAKINVQPSMPQKRSRQFLDEADSVDNALLYAVLCCIQYMLNICNTNSLFKQHLISLVDQYPNIDYDRLGFTKNWKNEKLWTV